MTRTTPTCCSSTPRSCSISGRAARATMSRTVKFPPTAATPAAGGRTRRRGPPCGCTRPLARYDEESCLESPLWPSLRCSSALTYQSYERRATPRQQEYLDHVIKPGGGVLGMGGQSLYDRCCAPPGFNAETQVGGWVCRMDGWASGWVAEVCTTSRGRPEPVGASSWLIVVISTPTSTCTSPSRTNSTGGTTAKQG